MGGVGSGRLFRWNEAPVVNDYRSIDVRRWKRDGFLFEGNSFGWNWSIDSEVTASIQVRVGFDQVRLIYRHRSPGGDWQSEDYPVGLTYTPCNAGGQRVWFRCPAQGCGRRVAKLYGGGIFACRQCYRLAYPSQRENLSDRASRRAEKIRERLGWPPGILNGEFGKPKGMHWRTFERLCREHDYWSEMSIGYIVRKFGIGFGLD